MAGPRDWEPAKCRQQRHIYMLRWSANLGIPSKPNRNDPHSRDSEHVTTLLDKVQASDPHTRRGATGRYTVEHLDLVRLHVEQLQGSGSYSDGKARLDRVGLPRRASWVHHRCRSPPRSSGPTDSGRGRAPRETTLFEAGGAGEGLSDYWAAGTIGPRRAAATIHRSGRAGWRQMPPPE
jgi:hypothetical protein